MLITNIKYDENSSLFNVVIDESESFYISYELYERYNLSIGYEINIETYNILEKENFFHMAKKSIENFINYKMRTVKEVETKLSYTTDDKDSVKSVIDYYKNLGFLNDEIYAEEFIKTSLNFKNLSKSMTKFKLIQKGVDTDIIERYLSLYDDEIDYENAKIIFEKKFRSYDKDDYSSKQKAFRYLTGKGFGYDVINRIIK